MAQRLNVFVLAIVAGLVLAAQAGAYPDETTFELTPPLPLGQVADALDHARVLPVAFDHTGATEGAFATRQAGLTEIVASYRRRHSLRHEGDPLISRFTVRGVVPTGVLRELPGLSAGPLDSDADPSAEGPSGSDATAPLAFAPDEGTIETIGLGDARPGERSILHTLTWESPFSIAAFRPRDAYEHDLKLINADNTFGLGRPLCGPLQSYRFWAVRDDIYIDTNFSAAVKPYIDTDFLDPCTTQDLTVGLYHPRRLIAGKRYTIFISTDAGDLSSSPYVLSGQRLSRICSRNAFCVGLDTSYTQGEPLLGPVLGRAPECRAWAKGQRSRLCREEF